MIRPRALLACLLVVAACGEPPANLAASNEMAGAARPAAPRAEADIVAVRLETEAGPIVVAVDTKRAPVTAANFLAYVDQGRFDGTSFYRAARTRGAEQRGFIQGGIRRAYRRMLPPIAHEPTSRTGLAHETGTISMARAETGAGAMGDFFITLSAMPAMDARGGEPGFAAFGRVVEGMDVARRILAGQTVPDAGRGAMRGQMLAAPVAIVRARRVAD
jgi:peptidyl-prolyl cis-trans isomerase A (cyclophilin A)